MHQESLPKLSGSSVPSDALCHYEKTYEELHDAAMDAFCAQLLSASPSDDRIEVP